MGRKKGNSLLKWLFGIGLLALIVFVALYAGLFSTVGLQGNRITFTNAPTKSAFAPTENPSFTITTSAFSQSSYSNMATQYGAYAWITDIYIDGKDMGINLMAPCGNDIFGNPTTGMCPVFTDCNIYGEGTKLCPGPCNSILVATPYGQKINVSAQQILAYSLPQDRFNLLSPLAPGQHTIKVVGYIAGSPTPPNTKGWTCESAAKSGAAAVWEDTFNVTGTGGTVPINGTNQTTGGTAPHTTTQTISIPSSISDALAAAGGGATEDNTWMLVAIGVVIVVLAAIAIMEGWVFKKKK